MDMDGKHWFDDGRSQSRGEVGHGKQPEGTKNRKGQRREGDVKLEESTQFTTVGAAVELTIERH